MQWLQAALKPVVAVPPSKMGCFVELSHWTSLLHFKVYFDGSFVRTMPGSFRTTALAPTTALDSDGKSAQSSRWAGRPGFYGLVLLWCDIGGRCTIAAML
jgi:hypothetical protein